CKGVDPNLRENIRSWINQDYPDYHIFFIVESDSDPAIEILREFPTATLFIAGHATDCGQKIHNLRYAIDHLPVEFEVFAFVDSDANVKQDWLRALVSNLLDHPDEASTGYRWFLANDFASYLRAAWNAGVLTLFDAGGGRNFAWGGSMAIFRKTFFELH